MRISVFAVCIIVILALPACGGGRATVRTSGQSCGQELTDLKTAYDAGTISKREYDRVRDATLKRCRRTK